MAKKKAEIGELDEVTEPVDATPEESSGDEMLSFEKWVQLTDPKIHPYSKAYVGAQFRGIMMTSEGWTEEVSAILDKE